MKVEQKTIEKLVVYAVLCQPVLVLLQHIMISVLGMSEDSTTIYRVLGTAGLVLPAIIYCFSRRPRVFFLIYVGFLALCLFTSLLFPDNGEYLWPEALKFTIPMVISTILCLWAIGDVELCDRCMYRVSWAVVWLTLLYIANMLRGTFSFEQYDMSFSYAMLLPSLVLYAKKTWLSVPAAFFLIFVVLAIGSRGVVVAFFLYILYDAFFYDHRVLIPLGIIIALIIIMIPVFMSFLGDFGISSRTLELLLSGQGGTLSDRDILYATALEALQEKPLFGLGIYGDRPLTGGFYCHNFFLEVCVHFGFFLGPVILVIISSAFLLVWYKLDRRNRALLVKYFCAGFVPMMASGSYLSENNFGIFAGVFLMLAQTVIVFKKTNPSPDKKNEKDSADKHHLPDTVQG